jgi:hypothetical protein
MSINCNELNNEYFKNNAIKTVFSEVLIEAKRLFGGKKL